MKVDQTTSGAVQGSEVHGAKHARRTHGAKGAERAEGAAHSRDSGAAANAEVSDRAREMAAARAAANDAPETRDDRIAEIKARIAAGKYNVDPHAVADRLVDEHIRMSGIG